MMMTSQEIVATYEAMSQITAQMVAAASAGDWSRLVLLEQQCAAYVTALKESEPPAALEGASRDKKVAAIRKMLADDRQIRDLTLPWMAKLASLIHSTGTERRLARAYGNA
jgi:flagellar protein FliT